MSKRFWLAIIAVVVIFGGILIVSKQHTKNSSPKTSASPTSHIQGRLDSRVKLVEYGDYQCPVCKDFYAVAHQVSTTYNDRIAFQFRNLPLSSIHPNSFAAARAAEAAGLQNKYWEMHDLLYINQTAWAKSNDAEKFFTSYASQLGLNSKQFQTDFASEKVNNAINADLKAFAATKDDMATPTFYLNGKKIDNKQLIDNEGRPSLNAFAKIIDAELAKNS